MEFAMGYVTSPPTWLTVGGPKKINGGRVGYPMFPSYPDPWQSVIEANRGDPILIIVI